MHVADLGKQVMFDLEIEPAHVPVGQNAFGTEIGCRLDLVDGPLILDNIFRYLGHREIILLHRMGQLEDHRHGQAKY